MLNRIFGSVNSSPASGSTIQKQQRRDSADVRQELLHKTISEIRGISVEQVEQQTSPTKTPIIASKAKLTKRASSSSRQTQESESDSGFESENSSVVSEKKSKNTMNTLLRDFGLEAYIASFKEAGFNTPMKIAGMTGADVDVIKMKLIHKKKLTKLINHLSENPPKPQAGDDESESESGYSSSEENSSMERTPSLERRVSAKSDSDSDYGYMGENKAKKNTSSQNTQVNSQKMVSPVSEYSSEGEASSASSSSSGSRSRSLSESSSMSEMSEMADSQVSSRRSSRNTSPMPRNKQSPSPMRNTDQMPASFSRNDSAAKKLFGSVEPIPRPAPVAKKPNPPAPAYIPPPKPPPPKADIHKLSNMIAAAEEHSQVLVSTITVQTQLLDQEKAKLLAAQKGLQSALTASSSAGASLSSALDKSNKRLESDRIEMTMLADTKFELTDEVEALVDEEADLDDQLAVDEESLEAKSDEIADLLSQNQDISEEKEALKALIEETKKKLIAKKYLERVAKRQERVVKASHQPAPKSKYANVRYTMAK